jgi:hypothetical protein
LRLSRFAGNPDRDAGGVLPPALLTRSVRKETVLSLGDATRPIP